LQIFANNLYLSEDKALRSKSFELLDIANSNQDLSDEMFIKLELERAAHFIAVSSSDKKQAIEYLNKQTKEGNKLSIKVFESLINELNNNEVLSVLNYASKNK